jgi:hypothetical protein
MLCLSNGSAARKPSRKDKHPFEDNPFREGFLGWKDSPKGQRSTEALDLVCDALGHVDVDASLRKIVWTDGPPLSIEEVVGRIHAEHADMPRDVIETQVFRWLEDCAPESYSKRQVEEFTRSWSRGSTTTSARDGETNISRELGTLEKGELRWKNANWVQAA